MDTIIISLLALVATFYQLYLQRIHNEKSLKPLIQVDLTDHKGLIYIHIQNNGVGPFIIERLSFFKDGQIYFKIEDCLDLSPRSYQYIPVTESVKKVLSPGTFHQVFSMQFGENHTDAEINNVRQQLSVLKLKVEGRDIYNNKLATERPLDWFARNNVVDQYSSI